MLAAFWDCCGLVYIEFGPDAHKGKRNVIQDTYFDTLMCLRNAMSYKIQGLLSRKVILIRDNAHLHWVQLIETLLKDFNWKQFE